jgi:hypothetical protein
MIASSLRPQAQYRRQVRRPAATYGDSLVRQARSIRAAPGSQPHQLAEDLLHESRAWYGRTRGIIGGQGFPANELVQGRG